MHIWNARLATLSVNLRRYLRDLGDSFTGVEDDVHEDDSDSDEDDERFRRERLRLRLRLRLRFLLGVD